MIPARSGDMRQGLLDMIEYINTFQDTKELTILEIGAYCGESACIFAEHFKFVYSIDAWEFDIMDDSLRVQGVENIEAEYDKNISKYKNIIKIKGKSKDLSTQVLGVYDVIYIDGGHDYDSVKTDIEAWKDKVKYFLCGHDYWQGRFDGVIKAVNEIRIPDKIFCDNSWIIKL